MYLFICLVCVCLHIYSFVYLLYVYLHAHEYGYGHYLHVDVNNLWKFSPQVPRIKLRYGAWWQEPLSLSHLLFYSDIIFLWEMGRTDIKHRLLLLRIKDSQDMKCQALQVKY